MNWGRIFFGGVILGAGMILLLSNAGMVDAGEAFKWFWPAVLVFAGLLSFVANPRHWLSATLLVGIGVVIMLSLAGAIDAVDLIFPAALIIIGIFVIFGRGWGKPEIAADHVRSFNVFSGSELRSSSQSFTGGDIAVLFGGAELDLRQAGLTPSARLDCFVAFGGTEIKVPEGWRILVKGMPIFGAVENKTTAREDENAPTLEVAATVLFGGLEIKN